MKALVILAMAALSCPGQVPSDVELPETPGLYAIIETSMGRMVALLYDDVAPLTVQMLVVSEL